MEKLPADFKINITGDITKTPSLDFLHNESFLKYNNNYYKNSYIINKQNIINLLTEIPAYSQLIKEFNDKNKTFEVIIPKKVLKELQNGNLEWVKRKNSIDQLTPMIKEVGKNKFKHQIELKKINFSQPQINKIITSSQMLTIQNSIRNISNQLENLDFLINQLKTGQQNDRLAWIQSGYNLFLQAKNSKDSMKYDLLPIALGQLNIGREQLLLSLKNDIIELNEYKTGIKAFFEQIMDNKTIRKESLKKTQDIIQATDFIIRSTQLLSIIYQDLNENWSMLQSVLRLNDMFDLFDKKTFNSICRWNNKIDVKKLETQIKNLKMNLEKKTKTLINSPKDICITYSSKEINLE